MSATVTMSAVAAKAGARLSSRVISKQVRPRRPSPQSRDFLPFQDTSITLSHQLMTPPPLYQARALNPTARVGAKPRRSSLTVKAMLVTIEHEGKTYEVECDGHDNILDAAIDAGIENLSYDCKMGVCMTCPSRVTAGKVDQAGSMLSDDVEEKGFALLCCAVPLEEGVVIKTVTEEELLDEQLCA